MAHTNDAFIANQKSTTYPNNTLNNKTAKIDKNKKRKQNRQQKRTDHYVIQQPVVRLLFSYITNKMKYPLAAFVLVYCGTTRSRRVVFLLLRNWLLQRCCRNKPFLPVVT